MFTTFDALVDIFLSFSVEVLSDTLGNLDYWDFQIICIWVIRLLLYTVKHTDELVVHEELRVHFMFQITLHRVTEII